MILVVAMRGGGGDGNSVAVAILDACRPVGTVPILTASDMHWSHSSLYRAVDACPW